MNRQISRFEFQMTLRDMRNAPRAHFNSHVNLYLLIMKARAR